jgi:hypothetical protein
MYDVDYFIYKFEKIPEELWCMDEYHNSLGQSCALGHCGYSNENACNSENEQTESLLTMFLDYLSVGVVSANDGESYKYKQPTPKQRILAALYDIKSMQPRKDITSELAVLPVNETSDIKTTEYA